VKDHKFIRDRLNPRAAADQGIRYPNQGQQRATSQPLTDSSSSLSTGSSERSSSSSISHRDWNCRVCNHPHTGTDVTSWRCVKCEESKWDVSSFEEFKDVPTRGRPRESRR
jgi:hypothetical protein